MLSRRILVCLDVKDGRVVKGVNFVGLKDQGDPVELAARYQEQGADEIVFLDVSATREGRKTLFSVVQKTAESLSIPLTVGGGISSVEDMGRALRAGADKVGVNSAAVRDPGLLGEAMQRYGAQCVVASIDAKVVGSTYRVHTHGGSRPTNLEAVSWAVECASMGAGEILLTSIDRDGARIGFDHTLLAAVVEAVDVPVIASGGAGNAQHFLEAFEATSCDGALAAGIFHDGTMSVIDVKEHLRAHGATVRPAGQSMTRRG